MRNKRDVIWGMLFHMLGMRDRAATLLEEKDRVDPSQSEDPLDKLANWIVQYSTIQISNGEGQERALQEIVKAVGLILDPVGMGIVDSASEGSSLSNQQVPNLSAEPERGTSDSPRSGYSRDPFRKIDNAHLDDISLAVVSYLLRGHALVFCRPQARRDYNVAKTALNDVHQAYQLAWRLYQQLEENHQRFPDWGLGPYLTKVIESQPNKRQPGQSPYFVWSLFLLCEIFRANTYKQIDYIDEADRHYRHAEQRFEMLLANYNKVMDRRGEPIRTREIVTPTLIRALLERSKAKFDLGQFLESLLIQLRCIQLMVAVTDRVADSERDIYAERLDLIAAFMDAERAAPFFDRERLCFLFGNLSRIPTGWNTGSNEPQLKPREFVTFLNPEFAEVAAAILVRMGFILYTLRPRWTARREWKQGEREDYKGERGEHAEWLRDYFRFDLIWNARADKESKIQAPPAGIYCQTLLGAKLEPEVISGLFPDDLERRLALRLRMCAPPSQFAGELLDEEYFYRAILAAGTENIGNLVTIPRRNRRLLMRRGYRYRRTLGDLSKKTVADGMTATVEGPFPEVGSNGADDRGEVSCKFVVLRRWQSYNPKIPHPPNQELRGGGYFLLWNGKGIVIDPGYDFIQNFYDEGFSLADIDAIIVSHSHPDHDDDLSSLTVLVKEWNEYYEKIGQSDQIKRLDLFLNDSTHLKFSSWLQASSVKIGRVIPLPLLQWHKDGEDSNADGVVRGRNAILDLRRPAHSVREGLLDTYDLRIEIVPAWHDDVIGRTAAVGLKFHLYRKDGRRAGILGYTGDSGAYGLDITDGSQSEDRLRIDREYEDCDVLVAHLGDIRLRELSTVLKCYEGTKLCYGEDEADEVAGTPLFTKMLRDCFSEKWEGPGAEGKFRRLVRDFLDFLISLDLASSDAFKVKIPLLKESEMELQEYLGGYIASRQRLEDERPSVQKTQWRPILEELVAKAKKMHESIDDQWLSSCIWMEFQRGYARAESEWHLSGEKLGVYLMLELLCLSATIPWQYKYHLGIFGIYMLFQRMVRRNDPNREERSRVFVVGELPEELTSYRHLVAHWLNVTKANTRTDGSRYVYAYTGDIGLHIGLNESAGLALQPKIRCVFCNYNNEMLCGHQSYWPPEKIVETPIKRLQASMIYLCKEKDHHPDEPDHPVHFMSRPELRAV